MSNAARVTGQATPRIFCWVNSGKGTDWQIVMAMAEDGTCLASHCSSSDWWARRDITSPDKIAKYEAHYPDGCEVEWVDDATPGKHPGLDAAYALNQTKRTAEPNSVAQGDAPKGGDAP